jgi:hypothetical protein
MTTMLAAVSYTPLYVISVYMLALIGLGLASRQFSKGTSADYFLVSRNIGPFLLLMSIFGTTMTGFALVGSTGKSYTSGIGVYGLMASWSGLIHSAVFFVVGMKLWAVGKRYGYLTQCEYFRERFQSPALGHVLFPVLILLVIPYLLVGVISAGKFIQGSTAGMFPELFPLLRPDGSPTPLHGSVPVWAGSLVVCLIVLFYVFFGGLRGAIWANTMQTLVFMVTGVIAFYLISQKLGGLAEAGRMVSESEFAKPRLAREGMLGQPDSAVGRHVSASVPALAYRAQCEELSPQPDRTPDLHHDCLVAVYFDRHLGGRALWRTILHPPQRGARAGDQGAGRVGVSDGPGRRRGAGRHHVEPRLSVHVPGHHVHQRRGDARVRPEPLQ